MDRHEWGRRAAQHALLDALRQFYPEPLVELHAGLPSGMDLEDWAARWNLLALRDLVPHLVSYWARRPGAAARLYFPRLRPLPPAPRPDAALDPDDPGQPLLAAPERAETQEAFLERAKEHYQRRAESVSQPRQLSRHAEWFVRSKVQGWTAARIAEAATTARNAPDVSTIRKGVAEFARLLAPSVRN